MILAELHGYRFACRIDSGADAVAISDTVVEYLGDKGFFDAGNGRCLTPTYRHMLRKRGERSGTMKKGHVLNMSTIR